MTFQANEYDFVFKILIIGNSSVGKTSLLLRFSDEKYDDVFIPTIGVDFKIRTIEQSGSIIKLQMWDTAGQDKFRTITSSYYKGAQGILFVFDLCNRKSLEDIQNWNAESERYGYKNSVKFLIGNKCDLYADRQIDRAQAQMFAENEGMKYYQSSAKANKNVELIFRTMADDLKQVFGESQKQKQNKKSKDLVLIRQKEDDIKRACC